MTDDSNKSPVTKLTATKQRWAREGRFLTGQTTRPEAERLPPGQHLTNDWPVLDLGITPNVQIDRWRLDIHGAVEAPQFLSFKQFSELPQTTLVSDIHCVTTWSRYDNSWSGVAINDILALCQPRDEARFVMLHSFDGYTTNLTLDDFASPQALLVSHWNGEPLAREHGGPVRAVVPHLYFWKSAKWLQRIEVRADDKPGFWEERGYHTRGDPWLEQRYSGD